MSGIIIDKDLCVGCGACVSSCAAGALDLANDVAVVNDNCVMCGVCVDTCPVGAISLERGETKSREHAENIWVFAEQRQGEILPVAFELLGKGKELAQKRSCKLIALLGCAPAQAELAQKLLSGGADEVWLGADERLAENLEENYAEWIVSLTEDGRPEILLIGATGFGRSLAPKIAARLRTGLTADCTVLEIDEETGLLQQTRPAFGGNLMATIITPNHRPQMATVRPGVMPAPSPLSKPSGQIIAKPFPDGFHAAVQLLKQELVKSESIADASVIVAAGRGIGSQKNLALAQELAELLGGSLGCSRPLVDVGWCEYPHQVGQTGCIVSPDLYIAIGISGAIQHLAGITGAKTVIAINTDPDAPIFGLAHYKIVGDCAEILKQLVDQLKEA